MTSEFWRTLCVAYYNSPLDMFQFDKYHRFLEAEVLRLQKQSWKIYGVKQQMSAETIKYCWSIGELPVWSDDSSLDAYHPLREKSTILDKLSTGPLQYYLSYKSLGRAVHDYHHFVTGLDFSPAEEVLLSTTVIAQGLVPDGVACVYASEVAGQAAVHKVTGEFVRLQQPRVISRFKLKNLGLVPRDL